MKLIFPNPKLSWCKTDINWFLQLADNIDNHVGMLSGNNVDGYGWSAYTFLNSIDAIAWGKAKTLAEAKKKVKEALIAAGVAK